jgi:hypothetical protein
VVQLFFQQHGAVAGERAAAFGVGLGGEQHLAHIGVHDDGVGRQVLGLGARERAHLNTVFGIGQCILVGHLGQAQRLVAHAQARRVHHDKHAVHTLVGRAHQSTHGTIQNHLASGAAFDPHFVLQAAAINTIALAQATVFIHQKLRHDKQTHTLDTGGCIA